MRRVEIIYPSFKTYTMIDEAIRIVEKVFGQDNVEKINNKVTIRLSPFIISNEMGDVHRIEGLWIRFDLFQRYDKLHLQSLEGMRTSQTREEYNNNYGHSHLQSQRMDTTGWSTFCKGADVFAMSSANMASGIEDINYLDFYLMQLSNFLTFEDVGNPYRFIRDLLPVRGIRPKSNLDPEELSNIRYRSVVKQLQFNSQFELLDNRHNHDLLLSISPYKYNDVFKINGRYVTIEDVDNEPIHVNYDKVCLRFKDESIHPVLLESPVYQIPETRERFIHPYVFTKLSNYLANELKERSIPQAYERAIDARKAYLQNIRQLPEPNQVLMFKNL